MRTIAPLKGIGSSFISQLYSFRPGSRQKRHGYINPPKLDRDDPNWDVPQAVEMSVRVNRKARGLNNPEDCVRDAPDCEWVIQAFLLDVLAALDDDEDASDSSVAGGAG